MTTELIWQHIDAPGWEHVRIISDHPGWTVFDSILVRQHAGLVLRGGYTLVVDKQWRTLELRLMLETSPGTMEGIHLLTEGDGRWTDANDQHIPELDGCLDVDIDWTPLTNALPVHRLRIKEGEEHAVPVVHISLPTMSIQPETHRYHRLNDSDVTHSVGDDNIIHALSMGNDGFVVQYPERFLRTGSR